MVVGVEVAHVVGVVAQYDEDEVVFVEFAEQHSVLVVVQTVHIGVPPHLPTAQRGVAVTLEADAMNGFLAQNVSSRRATFDGNLREVAHHKDVLDGGAGFQRDLDGFGFSVGIGGEVHNLRARLASSEVVFAVAQNRGQRETLDIIIALAAVSIDDVVDGSFVVLLVDLHVLDVLAHENFLGHTHHLVFSVFVEDNDVVEVGAVAHELVFLQRRSDESFVAVDVEFLVGLHHLRSLDGVEVANLCATRMVGTVFLLDAAEPLYGHVHHVGQVVVDFLDVGFDACHQLVGLVFVEFQDALHLDFHEPQNVVACHLADEAGLEGRDALVDMSHHSVHVFGILELLVLVDTLFDENLLQRGKEELLLEFALADEQFFA